MNKKIVISLISIISLVSIIVIGHNSKNNQLKSNIVKNNNQINIKSIKESYQVNDNLENNKVNNDLLAKKLESVNASIKFMEEKDKEKQVKIDLENYYKSLPLQYEVDMEKTIPIEKSLFKDVKYALAAAPEKEIIHKFVFKFPINNQELTSILRLNINKENEVNEEFSLRMPYQNYEGEIKYNTIHSCYSDRDYQRSNTLYCKNEENKERRFEIMYTKDYIIFELLKAPSSDYPTNKYELKNNELFMYNHLNENLKYEISPGHWGNHNNG